MYWFDRKHKSSLFNRLFELKLQGVQGGLEWITWAFDKMVRDLIESDPIQFCPARHHYFITQGQVQKIAAYIAARNGTLYGVDDSGTIILGKNYTQILDEQKGFTDKKCSALKNPKK